MSDEFNKYDLGDLVLVRGTFTDFDSEDPLDPTTVKLSVRDPSGNVETYIYESLGTGNTLDKESTGVYSKEIDCDEAGDWFYRWFSTGNGQAAKERHFEVLPARAVEV